MMERRWALNNPKQEGKPNRNGKFWPNRMTVSFQVECSMNLKMMIDIAHFKLEKKGIYISWKQV